MEKDDQNPAELRRREALAKLAKLSIYTAPSISLLLSAETSAVVGSCAADGNLQTDVSGWNMLGDGFSGNYQNNDNRGRRNRTDC